MAKTVLVEKSIVVKNVFLGVLHTGIATKRGMTQETSINFCMSGYYLSGLLMTCHNRIILPYICLSYAMVVSEKHLNTAGNYVKYMQLHPLLEKTSTKKIHDTDALTIKPRRIGQRKLRLFVTKLPYRKKFQIFKLFIFQIFSPCFIQFPYGYKRNLRN